MITTEGKGDDPMTTLEAPARTETPDTAEVMRRHKQMVYAICCTHTRCRGDADDAFQEVFLTYHRKQPVCRDDEHRKAWLIRTALTVTRRVATSSWSTRVVLAPDDARNQAVFEVGDKQQDSLFQALSSLPETYRSVIHLFYFEDLPVAQIATLLEQSQGAVKTRLSRGRDMLREAMKEDSNA